MIVELQKKKQNYPGYRLTHLRGSVQNVMQLTEIYYYFMNDLCSFRSKNG